MVKKYAKRVMHVQSCHFAIVFLEFSLRSSSSLLFKQTFSFLNLDQETAPDLFRTVNFAEKSIPLQELGSSTATKATRLRPAALLSLLSRDQRSHVTLQSLF